jgi:hypothetical protein
MPAIVWSKVGVAVQSALAAPVAITTISLAATGVVTHAGASPVNGDFVLLKVQGMAQVDYKVVRVAAATATTFQLEGVDTTAFDAFTSGTFERITFGTTINNIADWSVSGGDFDFIDVTTIHDNVKKQIPGSANPSTISATTLWDPSDAGSIALKNASDSKAIRCIRIVFASGARVVFAGYVGYTNFPTGQAQARVEAPLSFTAYGLPTAYAS